jgi:hypothetical protein
MVSDFMTLRCQMSDDRILEIKARMVAADMDSHGRIFSKK